MEKTEKLFKTSPMTTDNLKSSDIARQLALGVHKIVIDPGHGAGGMRQRWCSLMDSRSRLQEKPAPGADAKATGADS